MGVGAGDSEREECLHPSSVPQSPPSPASCPSPPSPALTSPTPAVAQPWRALPPPPEARRGEWHRNDRRVRASGVPEQLRVRGHGEGADRAGSADRADSGERTLGDGIHDPVCPCRCLPSPTWRCSTRAWCSRAGGSGCRTMCAACSTVQSETRVGAEGSRMIPGGDFCCEQSRCHPRIAALSA